jgi:hypothetical protein
MSRVTSILYVAGYFSSQTRRLDQKVLMIEAVVGQYQLTLGPWLVKQ